MFRRFSALLLLAGLTACDRDPYEAPGTWQSKGLNDANLRVMVANPHDLVEGDAAAGTTGNSAVPAVQRLVDDKRRGLITDGSTNAVGAQGGAGGAGTGGGN